MISLGIATLKEREMGFKKVLESVYPQVDVVYAVLNNYLEVPDWLSSMDRVQPIVMQNQLGDAGKFMYAGMCEGDYISWDDDLLMPEGAVRYLLSGVKKYRGLVGFHGRKYLHPVISFKQWADNYRCLNTVSDDVHVNLIGSGCCAYNTETMELKLSDFKLPNMADLYLSRAAAVQGVPMVVLKHRQGYLQYLKPQGETIWQATRDFTEHTNILQSYVK